MEFNPLTDKPASPEDLSVSDVYADHCKLSWKPPADDGGAEVTGNVLQYLCLR